MKVTTTDGKTKNYKLNLEMLGLKGFRWNDVDYEHIIEVLEQTYPELKGKIVQARL